MWPRVVEAMLGCWLLSSPFIFRHDPSATALWINDLGVGSLIVVAALLSFWERAKRAHLLLIPIGAWLIGFAFLSHPHPLPPAYQNHIVLALLLLMLSILPGEASLPPEKWREFEAREAAGDRDEGTRSEVLVGATRRAPVEERRHGSGRERAQ